MRLNLVWLKHPYQPKPWQGHLRSKPESTFLPRWEDCGKFMGARGERWPKLRQAATSMLSVTISPAFNELIVQ